jgi:hypothetical protein
LTAGEDLVKVHWLGWYYAQLDFQQPSQED